MLEFKVKTDFCSALRKCHHERGIYEKDCERRKFKWQDTMLTELKHK